MRVQVESLVEVELRSVWPNEASHFTPWLADNLEHLSAELSMDLELVGTEVGVGPFAADIVATDTATDRRVVIENFLEVTDHDHLGKLITYASGLDADYAVLVARRFRPEHRTALTWLNSRLGSDSGFFAVEVRAVRIGESAPAVQLDVVVEPDDWARQAAESVRAEMSVGEQRYQRWWAEFLDAVQSEHPGWTQATLPPRQNWMTFPAGRSGIHFAVTFSWPDSTIGRRLRVELYAHDGSLWWPALVAHRADVDAALPGLEWEDLPNARACRVAVSLPDAVPEREDDWPTYRRWALDQLGAFRSVFGPIVRDAALSP